MLRTRPRHQPRSQILSVHDPPAFDGKGELGIHQQHPRKGVEPLFVALMHSSDQAVKFANDVARSFHTCRKFSQLAGTEGLRLQEAKPPARGASARVRLGESRPNKGRTFLREQRMRTRFEPAPAKKGTEPPASTTPRRGRASHGIKTMSASAELVTGRIHRIGRGTESGVDASQSRNGSHSHL